MKKNNRAAWIVDDDKSIRWVLEKALQKASIATRTFTNAQSFLQALESDTPATLITDIRMPGIDGLELLSKVQYSYPDLPIIVMTAYSDLDSAVSAFNAGAFEYLPKPFDTNEVVKIVRRASAQSKQATEKPDNTVDEAAQDTPEIIGGAPAMQEVFRAIGRLARSHITVLINGESGTGKELVAKALHRHSPRSKHPFIALNMAAIPKDLMESELFGHEKGSFTGAHARRAGRFEQANKGTLFLDEIGDMPAELQTRLLRVLSDNEFYPVGARTSIKVDVRIIAATHQNIEALVEQGAFREDLFHRLNVIRIHIPALRDRKEDIPILMRHFLSMAAIELNSELKILQAKTEAHFMTLPWPGNVRQLENSCRWLTVMAPGKQVHLEDLPAELQTENSGHKTEQWSALLTNTINNALLEGEPELAKTIVARVESILIKAALAHTSGRKNEAASLLGYGRNTLTRKIKELAIDVDL